MITNTLRKQEDKKIEDFSTKFNDYDMVLMGKDINVSGGKITKEEIDDIRNYPKVESIQIMGLRQDTFDYFVNNYARQFKAISFFKNPLIGDLSALGNLKDIQYICIYWNQRAEKLWDMSNNRKLVRLEIEDFTRLHTLNDIVSSSSLRCLDFGDKVWSTSKFESLEPLAKSHCERVSFNCAKILDNNVSYLAQMPNLKYLDFKSNMFSTEQIAWLVAHLSDVQGRVLGAYYDWNENEVIICGKRKPILMRGKDDERIKRYADKFEKLVKKYRTISYEEAFGGTK